MIKRLSILLVVMTLLAGCSFDNLLKSSPAYKTQEAGMIAANGTAFALGYDIGDQVAFEVYTGKFPGDRIPLAKRIELGMVDQMETLADVEGVPFWTTRQIGGLPRRLGLPGDVGDRVGKALLSALELDPLLEGAYVDEELRHRAVAFGAGFQRAFQDWEQPGETNPE